MKKSAASMILVGAPLMAMEQQYDYVSRETPLGYAYDYEYDYRTRETPKETRKEGREETRVPMPIRVKNVARFGELAKLAEELIEDLGADKKYAKLVAYLKEHFAKNIIQGFKKADHEKGIALIKEYRSNKSAYDKDLIADFEALVMKRKSMSPYEY